MELRPVLCYVPICIDFDSFSDSVHRLPPTQTQCPAVSLGYQSFENFPTQSTDKINGEVEILLRP
jgi:hypothetical protein